MSLLTSPNTTKEQLKFLNKMQRYYHKRGSSQYVPKQKSHLADSQPVFSTKISSEAVDRVKGLMSQFMQDVGEVIRAFSMIDHYWVLEVLRKHQFFSDVAVLINGELHAKIEQLQRQLMAKDEKIFRLRKELNLQADRLDKLDNFNNKASIKVSQGKSVAANMYYHARAMEEEDFVAYYNRTSLANPITLKKVQSDAKKQTIALSEQINQLLANTKDQTNEEKIVELVKMIKQSQKAHACKNPCCQQKPDSPDTRLNKAKTLINTTHIKPSKNVYKNDKSEEYFKRYYRGSGFNLQDVTSVSKTKMEEMEKIENQYNRNLKARKKYEVHRYSCSFSGQ